MKRKADGSLEEGDGDASSVGATPQYQSNTPQEESPEIATKVSFPRLAKLRKDHCIETEIAVHLSKLHHITKDHKGFYRVRICRTCSGLPHLLELGSYSDLESATLANDVHEFLNHRTRHLHVITEEDIKYIDQISVTRTWRHERTEVKLLELLQERLDKSKINQIRSQQHTGAAYPYGAYGGMDPSRGMMNPQMMAGGMPWAMQQGGAMGGFMQQPGMPQGQAGFMDQTAGTYMLQQQQRMGGSGQPPMSGPMMAQSNGPQPGMNGMSPGGPPGPNGAPRPNPNQAGANPPSGMQAQGVSMGMASQIPAAGRAPGMPEAPKPGSVSMTVGPDDDSSDESSDRKDGDDNVMDTPNLEKSAAAAIAALCGSANPYALPSIQPKQEPPKPTGHQPQPQSQAQAAPTYPTQAQIRAASGAASTGANGGGPSGNTTSGAPNGSTNGMHPAMAAYMAQMSGGQTPGPMLMQMGGVGGEGSGPNAASHLTQQQQQQQQQMQQMQAYYQQMQAYQMQVMQQQRMQQGGGGSQGDGGSSANGGNNYAKQGQQQGQSRQGQSGPQMGAQQMQQMGGQQMGGQQMGAQQMGGQQMGGQQMGSQQMGGQQMGGQQGNPYAMYEQTYGGMPPSSMSNPLVASYNAHQANAFNANKNGYGAGGPGNGMMGPGGGMAGQSKAAMGSVIGGDPSGGGMTDLSEESIQRVTFMTYQFEGAKKLLFSKLSCACAVENNGYYINLIMDSLIALYVAPTYGNPVYAQNAMRAIEYVMNSGALTSGSLYMLVTAYTPGDMEATTEMVRNLHAALKEFETKYEQVECSTRRMNYYSAQLVGYFDQMRHYCKAIGASSISQNQLASDPKAPRLAHWEQMYTKILRCNHNFGLKCDLQLGLPVWWPNSVMPFAPAIGNANGPPVSNFFKSENVIRSEHSSIRYNYGLVSELVAAFNASGLEVLSERRQETDSDEVDYSGLENPSVLGSQTLILLLIQYGCSTLAVESLELADFSSGLQSTGATNSLAVNRYPLDRTVSQNSDTDIGSVGYGIGESCGRSSAGSVDACLKEFARWKKYMELRITDPVVKGMYQNVYMDLLAMQILCTAPVKTPQGTGPVAPVKTETKVHTFSYADDDASNILLELSKSSSGTALGPVASPPAVSTVAPPNASSNVFSSLLAAIDNVQPLQEKKESGAHVEEKLTAKDPGFAETSVARKIDTNSVAARDLFEAIRTVIGDTLATGISGPMFQHPSRNDTNKYAPHFSINHEISLRVNMSYLSVLSVISRRTINDRSMSESSCGDILETLDAEAIVQSVYRELLFLGEWIDSSDGGCPLFSYTFFSFAICLKSCRILLTAYPSLSETLKKIMTLIPRILTCCGRRKTVCQILLHYQEEVSPRT